jgi:hypothetical protein
VDDEHPDNKVVDRLLNNARTKEWKPMNPNEKHREQAAELYRNQFPRNKLGGPYSTAYATIDAISQAIADAEARGRESGIRECAHVVNAIQDKLPSDRKPNGSFDYVAAILMPKCREIWWECRESILALLKDGGE